MPKKKVVNDENPIITKSNKRNNGKKVSKSNELLKDESLKEQHKEESLKDEPLKEEQHKEESPKVEQS